MKEYETIVTRLLESLPGLREAVLKWEDSFIAQEQWNDPSLDDAETWTIALWRMQKLLEFLASMWEASNKWSFNWGSTDWSNVGGVLMNFSSVMRYNPPKGEELEFAQKAFYHVTMINVSYDKDAWNELGSKFFFPSNKHDLKSILVA